MCTKGTMPTHVWSLPYTNESLDKSQTNMTPIAIILAVSRENGLELIQTHPRSINATKFKCFLDKLRNRNPFDDILLVMDNLSFHKSRAMKERMDELGFMYTYTPTYSPQYNGIEEVIGMGKQMVKKRRLEMLLSGEMKCLN